MNALNTTTPTEIGELATEAISDILRRATGTSNICHYADDFSLVPWASLADSGWDHIGIAEEGEEAATLRDLAAMAQAWGERLLPSPFMETVIARRHSPAAAKWDGPVTFTLPSPSLGTGTGYTPFAGFEGIGRVTELGTGSGAVVLPSGGPTDGLDLALHASTTEPVTVFSPEAARETAVVYAATAVGSASRLLRMGIDYASEREQFGAAIGSFQAVKHHLTNALLAVEQAETAVIWASLDDDDPFRPALFAIDQTISAAEIVTQVFGGIGFTWELGLHYYLRHMLFAREIVVGLEKNP